MSLKAATAIVGAFLCLAASVHARTRGSSDWATSHAFGAYTTHSRVRAWRATWTSTIAHLASHSMHARASSWVGRPILVLVLMVATCAVAGPVELVVADRVGDLLPIQGHEHVLSNFVIGELNKTITCKSMIF